MDDADIFAAFTHLSPAYEAHEIPEEEDTMPTLNSPVHPIPVAQTAGAFLRHNLPTVVQRYLRFWHTAICRKPLDEFWQWYEPLLTYIGRGTGHVTDAFQHELKWHFHRVVWRMLGPFAQTGHGNTQHNPSVLVEHGETWRPTYTIHRLAIWHGAACDTPLHLAVNFMSRHEPARRTSVIAPHMLFNH
uniref:FGENESH: predicted gene_12.308 protein n=1 Tax=Rhodotorula toruloides TaxID=5286 RepID=A0A0K3CNN7_RHOTO